MEIYRSPISRDCLVCRLQGSQEESTGIACRIPLAIVSGQYFEIQNIYTTVLTIGIEMDIIVGIPVDGRIAISITAPVGLGIERASYRQSDLR